MALQIKSDIDNKLLRRREIRCLFPQVAGRITRNEAVSIVSQALKVASGEVYTISLLNKTGTRDTNGLFYIYSKPEDAKKHLPQYILTRMLSKDERRKVLDQARKSPKGAKQPVKAEKK